MSNLRHEVRQAVRNCTCPDDHKGQLEATLLGLNFNIATILQLIQTITALAGKYGPALWADIQLVIALLTGGKTPSPLDPTPGPTPAQFGTDPDFDRPPGFRGCTPEQARCGRNSSGLIVTHAHRNGFVRLNALVILLAFVLLAILLVGPAVSKARAGERLPQSTLQLPLSTLCDNPNCDCGPDCQCGPGCQCGKEKLPCGVSKTTGEFDAYADAVVYSKAGTEEEADEPLQQPPRRAAAVAAAPSFHYETRTICNGRRCVPYQVLVQDSLPQQTLTESATAVAAAAPATSFQSVQVPVTTMRTVRVAKTVYEDVQVPVTTYQTCQVPVQAQQSFGSTFAFAGDGGCASCSQGDGGSTAVASGRGGLFHRLRERIASRRSARSGGGCSSCGG
jgi:hypothetical protein